ncbi:MAG: PD40 domain-containing protein [Myxococcaceae bacterium]|nr:PD40 domain-containing protein [Myxococcaceae bacterium]
MKLASLAVLGLALLACPERSKGEVRDAGLDAGSALPVSGGPAPAAPPRFSEPHGRAGLWDEVRDAGWSLLFSSERAGSPQLHQLHRGWEHALTEGPAHHLQDVAWRQRAALVTRVDEPTEQLLAVSLVDGGVREVSPPMEKAHAAVLSADERLVVFEASLTHAASIAVAPFDGAGPLGALGELGDTGSFQPALTPDGRVLFTNSSSGDPELYVQPLDGGAVTRLTAFHLEDFGGVPAPDGQRFAFVSNREGNDRVFVQRLDGRGVFRLMNEPRGPEDVESDPVWMPDGASLLVTVRSKGVARIARVDVATRKTLWRTAGPGNDQLPRPSPDGRFIAFVSDRSGNADIWLVRATGKDAMAVTSHEAAEYSPRWGPQ